MEEEQNYELALAPEAFKKRYNELKQLDSQIRSLNLYGTVDRIHEINELKAKFQQILAEIQAVAWKGYLITFVEEPSFVSKANREHKLYKENGTWKIKGFEDIANAGATFDFDGKTGLPTKIKSKKKIVRLFGNPIDVPIEHEITYETQETVAAVIAKEAKKRKGYGKIVSKPKEWSCTRCHKSER